MYTIVAPLDLEEGHTIPLFSLLKMLKARGHRVICLGHPCVQSLIRHEGLEFTPIDAPKEAFLDANNLTSKSGEIYSVLLLQGMLDEALAQLSPDLVMIRSQYYTAGIIIHYRYRLPIIYYISSFRSEKKIEACESVIINDLMTFKKGVPELLELLTLAEVQFSNFKEIANLALQFPELILFPEAFDISARSGEPGVYYTGTGVDLARKEELFDWSSIDQNSPLIYCGLGSQSYFQAEIGHKLFQIVLDVAKEHLEWQFIIAIGKRSDPKKIAAASANVILTPWAPQLDVLRRTQVMINHGGFGTIKECIMMGVPMVVIPLMQNRDHSACADRVVHHGLGLQGDIERIDASELGSLIECVIKDQAFRQRIRIMREKFETQDRIEIGVQVIEEYISNSLNPTETCA